MYAHCPGTLYALTLTFRFLVAFSQFVCLPSDTSKRVFLALEISAGWHEVRCYGLPNTSFKLLLKLLTKDCTNFSEHAPIIQKRDFMRVLVFGNLMILISTVLLDTVTKLLQHWTLRLGTCYDVSILPAYFTWLLKLEVIFNSSRYDGRARLTYKSVYLLGGRFLRAI